MSTFRGAALATIVTAVAGVAACGTVLELDDYEVARGADSSVSGDTASDAGGDSCWRANGFPSGKDCFQCDASTSFELLNACTSAECVAFDNSTRIAGWDGALPPLPAKATEYGAIVRPPRPDPVTPCAGLSNVVYVYGSTALEHVLAPIAAQVLAKEGITIVFKSDPSCTAVEKMNTVLSGAAQYYTQTGTGECMITASPKADIVLSDLKAVDCSRDTPGEFASLDGPVQIFLFAVPNAGGQLAISREAAQLTFGYPEAKRVAPWTQPELVFRRHEFSGTQSVIGANIGLPAGLFSGVRVQSSGDMIPALADAAPPAAALGITSPDQLSSPAMRKDVSEIAYQHGGQNCAFLPDVFAGTLDKRNVRDGHYALWSPIRVFLRTTPAKASADLVAHLFEGTEIEDEKTYLSILKKGQVVPRCAMAVDRASPGADITRFAPDRPCTCAFERADPPALDFASKCVACTPGGTPCAKGKCSHGFCEGP